MSYLAEGAFFFYIYNAHNKLLIESKLSTKEQLPRQGIVQTVEETSAHLLSIV